MAETPLDLASLPCPAGYELDFDNGLIRLMKQTRACSGFVTNNGDGTWYGEYGGRDNECTVTANHKDAASAYDALLSALGLTPAPAADLDAQLAAMSEEARAAFAAKYGWDKAAPHGRTFTEAKVRVLMQGAWRHGFLRGKAKYLKKNTPHMPDLMEKDITAAIAAATDAGKDEPR